MGTLRQRSAGALAVLTGSYWLAVAALPVAVAPIAWIALYVVCAAALLALQGRFEAAVSAARGLQAAAYSVLLAAIFFGAGRGLDALKGAQRVQIDVAAHLGGLELWCVLCPGVTALALGCWVLAPVKPKKLLAPGLKLQTKRNATLPSGP